jgi:hypothetical protein
VAISFGSTSQIKNAIAMLPDRELDDAFGLTEIAGDLLVDPFRYVEKKVSYA